MAKVTLSTHTARIRRRRNPDSAEVLGAFDGTACLYDIVGKVLEGLQKEHSHDETTRHLLNVVRLESDGESLWGLAEAGDYGISAKGVNSKTGEPAYDRKPDDAEMIPFYFLINLPPDATRGIVILQRLGVRGMQMPFMSILRKHILEQYPEYLLEFQPHVPSQVLKYLTEGSLKGITLTRYKIPEDIADRLRLRGNLEEHVRLKTVVEATKDHFLFTPDWIKQVIKGDGKLFEVREGNEIPDEISVTMMYNGNRRTMDFTNPDKITPHIDVTDEVEVDETGHPSFASIHRYAEELLKDLENELGRLT